MIICTSIDIVGEGGSSRTMIDIVRGMKTNTYCSCTEVCTQELQTAVESVRDMRSEKKTTKTCVTFLPPV